MVPARFAAGIRGRTAVAIDAGTPGVDGDAWLRRLPGLLGDALDRWELRVDTNSAQTTTRHTTTRHATTRHANTRKARTAGATHAAETASDPGAAPSRYGHCALVVAVRRADGTPAALKLTWPHPEARHEHLALRAWAADGAVRLLAAHPGDWALLLERLDPDRDLTGVPEDEACAIIGALLRRLDRPTLPQLDTLSAWTRHFVQDSAAPDPRLPRRFIEQARALASDLLADDEPLDDRLVHTDLHYANVLARRADDPVADTAGILRARPDVTQWRAIDPKPMAAEPAFALWPALHNRWPEAIDGDLHWNIRCRLGWLSQAADVDEDRARAWAIIRTVADARDLMRDTATTDSATTDSATTDLATTDPAHRPVQTTSAAELLGQRVRLLKALQPDA
nr:aminoglycoside phosphotransferase family protein [Kineosphaera limosa]